MTVLTTLPSAASFAAAKLGQKWSMRWTGKQALNNLTEFPFTSTFFVGKRGLPTQNTRQSLKPYLDEKSIKGSPNSHYCFIPFPSMLFSALAEKPFWVWIMALTVMLLYNDKMRSVFFTGGRSTKDEFKTNAQVSRGNPRNYKNESP